LAFEETESKATKDWNPLPKGYRALGRFRTPRLFVFFAELGLGLRSSNSSKSLALAEPVRAERIAQFSHSTGKEQVPW